MKKWYVMLIGLLSFNLMAAECTINGYTWTYTVRNGKATITDVSPREGVNLIFPDVVDGYEVTAIDTRTSPLEDKSKLKLFTGTLVLPKRLVEIASYSFKGCSGFTGSLVIPDSVRTIGYQAFDGCSGFTGSLVIPDSVTTISGFAFSGCSGFTGSLTIGSSVTTIGGSAFGDCSGFTGSLTIGSSVTTIGDAAFGDCSGFTGSLTIPDSVTTIGGYAFYYCSGFTGSLTIGSSVTTIGGYAFGGCREFSGVAFKGLLPNGFSEVLKITSSPTFPEKYAAEWKRALSDANLREPMRDDAPVAKIISAKMRESEPTIMDVVYKVTSSKLTVKVRALAFQDGERSFAKVIRPETFVADENGNPTAGNIGDGITANEEHTISWKVSADWDITLAKVKFEVLAVEDEILPLELVTLTKTETQPEMVFSWNYVVPSRAFDALLWLYADKDQGLTLTNGVLKNGDKRLADGTSCDKTSYDALVYIYGKMGYELLQGERLNYVRERSRLDLPDVTVRQYAVKVIEE